MAWSGKRARGEARCQTALTVSTVCPFEFVHLATLSILSISKRLVVLPFHDLNVVPRILCCLANNLSNISLYRTHAPPRIAPLVVNTHSPHTGPGPGPRPPSPGAVWLSRSFFTFYPIPTKIVKDHNPDKALRRGSPNSQPQIPRPRVLGAGEHQELQHDDAHALHGPVRAPKSWRRVR